MIDWEKLKEIEDHYNQCTDKISEYFEIPYNGFNFREVAELYTICDETEAFIIGEGESNGHENPKEYTQEGLINNYFYTNSPENPIYKELENRTQTLAVLYIELKNRVFIDHTEELNSMLPAHAIALLKKELSEFNYRKSSMKRKGLVLTDLDNLMMEFFNAELEYRESLIQKQPEPDKQTDNLPPRVFDINDPNKIISVYDLCNEDFFKCEYLLFRNGIESANFNEININRQNCVQNLVYRLSFMMDKEWYSEICKNMKWRKRDCSGQKGKLENDLNTIKLDKLLPKQKK